jgi:hypothetical protein
VHDAAQFNRNRTRPDGLNAECRNCVMTRNQKRALIYNEQRRERRRLSKEISRV